MLLYSSQKKKKGISTCGPRLQFRFHPPQTQPVKGTSQLPPLLTSFSVEISGPSWRKNTYAKYQLVPMILQISPGGMEAGPMPMDMTRIGNAGAQESFQGRTDPDEQYERGPSMSAIEL